MSPDTSPALAVHAGLTPRLRRSALLLGVGLGGFFDGILLHQILQWHHLLSAWPRGVFASLRGQVLADGIFHALMYGLAAAGLVLLLRARVEFMALHAARRFTAHLMVGFGLWHVADAVLSHWVLGIHRIRMDTAYPLAWDLGWLAVFGLMPLAAGWLLSRGNAVSPPSAGPGAGPAVMAVTVAGTVLLAGISLRGPDTAGSGTITVVLRPGVPAARLLGGLQEERVVGSDAAGSVWVLQGNPADARRLYRHGALYVSGTGLPGGCASWLRL